MTTYYICDIYIKYVLRASSSLTLGRHLYFVASACSVVSRSQTAFLVKAVWLRETTCSVRTDTYCPLCNQRPFVYGDIHDTNTLHMHKL